MRIAIDGFSACGKSTLARALARKLGYLYIDTGAMYRAATWHFLNNGIDLKDSARIRREMARMEIRFEKVDGFARTLLNNSDVEGQIRKMEVSNQVSQVAAIPEVRHALVAQQRHLARNGGAVLDGRDIGTVVFPLAPLKIFLTADLDTRVERRFLELILINPDIRKEAVRKNLKERDHADTRRADSPLKQAPDAVVVDNTNLTPEEQLAMCYALARERMKKEERKDSGKG